MSVRLVMAFFKRAPGAFRGRHRNLRAPACVIPLEGGALTAEALCPVVAAFRLDSYLTRLAQEHATLWRSTPTALPTLGSPVGFWRHLTNGRAARRLIDDLAGRVASMPQRGPERESWRLAVRESLQRFGEERLAWPAGYRRLLLGDSFFDSSRAFARQARAFAPELSLADLGQALRNVWIGNSLQMLLDRPVALRPGLFAYSMLYPLTDNLLDDPSVGAAAKRAFNERFGRRLAGRPVLPQATGEAAVFRLVGQIEDDYPRREWPDVWTSLLAIHAAQGRSLRQQDDNLLGDDELLAITCQKGGTSLIADLYLVAGTASAAEVRFAFGYGVFLQLMDDLQDAEADTRAGHQTLFTRAARRGPLDEPATRLVCLIDRVLDERAPFGGASHEDQRDLIRRNCRALVVGAVAQQPQLFTGGFRRSLERQWPLSLGAQRRLTRRARRRFRDAGRAVQRRTGAPSLLDWLLQD